MKYKKDGNERLFFTYDYSGHLVKKTVLQGNLCDHPDTCGSALDLCDTINVSLCAYKPGDVNNNGQLNGIDAVFLNAWLTGIGPAPAPPLSRSDANCSGSVNGIDVTYIVSYLQGRVPAPSCCYWNCSTFVATYYIYSGDQVIAEYNKSGALEWNYVYGLGQRLAKYKGSEKWAYHNDHLGNVRAVTNVSGGTVNKADYYPYGERLFSSGDIGKYSYNGKEYVDDWCFDLYYYGARFMDPKTGRFITPDPIQDYLNQYSYVGNNPVNRIDPMGMLTQPRPMLIGISSHGFNLVGETEEQKRIFFDTKTKREIVEDAVVAAIVALREMATRYGSQKDKDDWEAMAKWLEEVLDPTKPGKLVVENPFVLPSTMNLNAVADFVVSENNPHGDLYVNENFVNGSYPSEFLTSYIILEAAHAVFNQQHPPSEFGVKSKDEFKGDKSPAAISYLKANEEYSWRHMITYMDKYVSLKSQKHYPLASGWYSILRNYRDRGIDETVEEILRGYKW